MGGIDVSQPPSPPRHPFSLPYYAPFPLPLPQVSAQASKPVMGVVQDTLVGAYLLSHRDVFVDPVALMDLVMWMPGWGGTLPPPAVMVPVRGRPGACIGVCAQSPRGYRGVGAHTRHALLRALRTQSGPLLWYECALRTAARCGGLRRLARATASQLPSLPPLPPPPCDQC